MMAFVLEVLGTVVFKIVALTCMATGTCVVSVEQPGTLIECRVMMDQVSQECRVMT